VFTQNVLSLRKQKEVAASSMDPPVSPVELDQARYSAAHSRLNPRETSSTGLQDETPRVSIPHGSEEEGPEHCLLPSEERRSLKEPTLHATPDDTDLRAWNVKSKSPEVLGDQNFWSPLFLRPSVLVLFILLFIIMLVALEVLDHISKSNHGLSTTERSKRYLWTYGPVAGNPSFMYFRT